MTIETFNSLCSKFGDQSYDEADRWKSIKYVATEGQMESLDFEYYFSKNRGYFINDPSIGTGFLLLEFPYVEFEPININANNNEKKKILTFIALTMVNALSFRTPDQTVTSSIIVNSEGGIVSGA